VTGHALDQRFLRSFVVVAETGSVTQAAAQFGRMQPAITMQLQKLEVLVGKQLFTPESRRTQLTEDGEIVMHYAKSLSRMHDEMLMRLSTAPIEGHVVLGTPDLYAAYLLPPELPETQLQELSEFAFSFVERNDQDLVGTLLDVNQTLYRDFEYVSAATTIATTPFEVFESRRGVCQDFANLMICMARLLQVPARYRMGYIFTGTDYENKVQSEASHAWVELYVPRMGWHGFDPTNGRQVGSEHVRVACGRDYRDATPTSGTIYRGGGVETLTVGVRVADEGTG